MAADLRPFDERFLTTTSYLGDIHHNPEKVGLEIVAQAEDPNLSYEFHYITLWRDTASGELFIGADSGCSCPTPFEDVRSLGDLVHVRTYEDVNRFIRANAEGIPSDELRAFLTKAIAALKG